MEHHDITPATSIDETKLKIVELKVRIARAEGILGQEVYFMQNTIAYPQILDTITKQHMCAVKSDNFDAFYTRVMKFTNNARVRQGPSRKANDNIVTEKETFHAKSEEDHDQEPNGLRGA